MQLRRWLAIAALLVGLGLAWQLTRPGGREAHVNFVLTRATVELDGTQLDRRHLTRVAWATRTSTGRLSQGNLTFSPGSAPEVSTTVTVALADDVTQLEVRCEFELAPGLPRVQTLGHAPLGAAHTDDQTLQLECGPWQRP